MTDLILLITSIGLNYFLVRIYFYLKNTLRFLLSIFIFLIFILLVKLAPSLLGMHSEDVFFLWVLGGGLAGLLASINSVQDK